ncbi:hypothetical protein BDV95DRAFT_605612 [Massariosphaeria phaeospora]|uniref:TauD/TfdA-like domain-containing protein n=1 Tax=Massariosphaeria phaeospora TaxID=100035 RepID=A0A7C8MAN7_9PLEO|nr:hypothetical protein BDV95DRAFT_605612 [Massariosphaeria phaeospora]
MSVSSLSARSSTESMRSNLSTLTAPDSLAPAVTGPMVWKGSMLLPNEYVIQLTGSELEDIRAAIVYFAMKNRKPRNLSAIDKSAFPLRSELAKKLSKASYEVHHGRGVAVVRGLRELRLNDDESTICFVGICSYVCPHRGTDSYANQTLSHVRDATRDPVPYGAENIGLAGSKIPSAMDYHSDRFAGDVLALHVRNDGGATDGGEQYLSSFWTIYNELLESDPGVLETMAAANWPFELKQQDNDPYVEFGPTLFFSKGRPICQLVKAPLVGSPRIPRSSDMPGLSGEQLHAIEAVQDMAKRFGTKLDRQTGDIQFVNNLSIMHARAAYGNNPGPSSRHLLRMFLRDPENEWEKPASFRNKFDDPFVPGRRQDIPVLDTDPRRKISGRDSHG